MMKTLQTGNIIAIAGKETVPQSLYLHLYDLTVAE
jgi:hypothetical protein